MTFFKKILSFFFPKVIVEVKKELTDNQLSLLKEQYKKVIDVCTKEAEMDNKKDNIFLKA